MRFGLVHRVMTDALASLGILALVLSGQFNRWVSVAVVVGLILALTVRDSWRKVAALKHLDTITVLAMLAIQLIRVLLNANVLDALVEFAAGLQIIRLATRKGAAHDQQVIVLALLHLVAGTVLGGGLGYGLCFVGILIVAPGALVLSHLRREVEGNYRQGARDRTGLPVDVPRILRSRRVVGRNFLAATCLLSIPILLFTGALFVVFPRVGLSLLLLNRGHTGRMIGFSGRVDLGEVGTLRSDPALAMRVEIRDLADPPPERLALHLRGTALDQYDGRTWTQSDNTKRPAEFDGQLIPIERYPDTASDRVMSIDLEPIDPPVVFLTPNATGLRMRSRTQGFDPVANAVRGSDGEFRYLPVDDRGLRYDVFVSAKNRPTFQRLTAAERPRYVSLPPDLSDRVRDLAKEWTAGRTTSLEKANAIQEHLRTEYRYDLASPAGRSREPLDDFLFESKRGHCEFYSTALAILLRVVDVPTRNVTGFVGGTYNRFGRFYAVRQGDAHSWVEVFVDGQGWLTFDPTPPADAAPRSATSGLWAYGRDLFEASSQRWERHVVGYDLTQQIGLLQSLRTGRGGDTVSRVKGRYRAFALPAGGLFVAVIVGIWLRRRTRVVGGGSGATSPKGAEALVATSLYESLDSAMLLLGIPRPVGLPPLRHALALAESKHPVSEEVLALTQLYLDARFGGLVLSEADRKAYEQRVRVVGAQAEQR